MNEATDEGSPDQAPGPGTNSNTIPTYPAKPRKLKKDGTPYKPRRGWGPYRSVTNERSVAFNLQLDVQNLQQEVQNLLALREILATKTLVQRHSAEGSLCKLVNEYLYVFRKGVLPRDPGQNRLMDDRDQRAFMHSVMDPEVDLGNGLPRGPDVIMDQMGNYSDFLNFISLTGTVDSIVQVEDAVLISDAASFVFQVTRSTIQLIFPHIIGDEWLVAQLVGQEVEAQGRSTFHFNAAGKCYRYDVEMSFVSAFLGIVKDPLIVDILFGRALITENGMIGILNEDDEEKEPIPSQMRGTLDTQETEAHSTEIVLLRPNESFKSSRSDEFCRRIVEDYFNAFANGYQGVDDAGAPTDPFQRDFFLHRFGRGSVSATTSYVKERWCALRECFEFLSFQQKGATEPSSDIDSSTCSVAADATYILRVTLHSIQAVFPHLVSNRRLTSTLVGKVIMVPSHICFLIEKSTGYISGISEQMNFEEALAEILQDQDDLSLVVTRALLVADGVDYGHSSTTGMPFEQQIQLPHLSEIRPMRQEESHTSSRTMSMADILK
ncbi:hypothetical protein PRIC2_004152 [Phytophthora ramorum]